MSKMEERVISYHSHLRLRFLLTLRHAQTTGRLVPEHRFVALRVGDAIGGHLRRVNTRGDGVDGDVPMSKRCGEDTSEVVGGRFGSCVWNESKIDVHISGERLDKIKL